MNGGQQTPSISAGRKTFALLCAAVNRRCPLCVPILDAGTCRRS